MADINQFGSVKPVRSGEGMSCAECEAMLLDAIDGVLSAKDRAAFELHIATCAECSQMLADAKRGATLLEMLKSPRPEPSAALFERIILQTTGVPVNAAHLSSTPAGLQTAASAVKPANQVAGKAAMGEPGDTLAPAILGANGVYLTPAAVTAGSNVLPFRPAAPKRFSLNSIMHTVMQPRLAMTAAMAFFSVALTLNLTGVHLNQLKASDLTPTNLKRSFYQADASVVRYYESMRVVYELETRVRDLQRSNDDNATPSVEIPAAKDGSGSGKSPSNQEQQKKTPKAGSGTSQRNNPLQQEFKLAAAPGLTWPRGTNGSARLINTGFVAGTNKSKEASQEGGMV